MAAALVAYNAVLNRWPAFHGWGYVPVNLAAAGVLVAAGSLLGLSVDQMGLAPDAVGLLIGLAAGGACGVPLLLVSGSRLSRLLADRRAGEGLAWYRAAIRIPLGTALFEEVAFRGVLLGLLFEYGRPAAVLVSSAVFGLWHVEPARQMARINGRDPSATIAATVVFTAGAGVLFGWLRVTSGGIALPTGLHAAVNVAAYLAGRRALARHRVASPS
jgi:uncharacterized protein